MVDQWTFDAGIAGAIVNGRILHIHNVAGHCRKQSGPDQRQAMGATRTQMALARRDEHGGAAASVPLTSMSASLVILFLGTSMSYRN